VTQHHKQRNGIRDRHVAKISVEAGKVNKIGKDAPEIMCFVSVSKIERKG